MYLRLRLRLHPPPSLAYFFVLLFLQIHASSFTSWPSISLRRKITVSAKSSPSRPPHAGAVHARLRRLCRQCVSIDAKQPHKNGYTLLLRLFNLIVSWSAGFCYVLASWAYLTWLFLDPPDFAMYLLVGGSFVCLHRCREKIFGYSRKQLVVLKDLLCAPFISLV
jgi:hypothetical protein